MRLRVNDEVVDVPEGLTVAGLLRHLGYGDAVVAVAVDGCFVPRSRHDDTRPEPDAAVEIVAPMQGG